jgi:hypothetical protein
MCSFSPHVKYGSKSIKCLILVKLIYKWRGDDLNDGVSVWRNEADASINCGNNNTTDHTHVHTDYYTDMGTQQTEVCQSNSEEKSTE